MSINIFYTALGLALLAGTSAVNAQTVIPRNTSNPPAETIVTQQPTGTAVAQQQQQQPAAPRARTAARRPVQTVQTTETVRTVRRPGAKPIVHRSVVTTTTRRTVVSRRVVPTTARRTVVSQAVAPAPTVIAPAAPVLAAGPVAAYPQPLYGVYDEAPPFVPQPLYDRVIPAADGAFVSPLAPGGGIVIPGYRYVYEPDRILVIDPATGVAIQAIPR